MQEKSYAGYLPPPSRARKLGKELSIGTSSLVQQQPEAGKEENVGTKCESQTEGSTNKSLQVKAGSPPTTGLIQNGEMKLLKCGLTF